MSRYTYDVHVETRTSGRTVNGPGTQKEARAEVVRAIKEHPPGKAWGRVIRYAPPKNPEKMIGTSEVIAVYMSLPSGLVKRLYLKEGLE